MSADPVVITAYARTPMGAFQGALTGASATQLGAAAVASAVARAKVAAEAVDQIVMGCVLPAGLGQAPARKAHKVWAMNPPPSTRLGSSAP